MTLALKAPCFQPLNLRVRIHCFQAEPDFFELAPLQPGEDGEEEEEEEEEEEDCEEEEEEEPGSVPVHRSLSASEASLEASNRTRIMIRIMGSLVKVTTNN